MNTTYAVKVLLLLAIIWLTLMGVLWAIRSWQAGDVLGMANFALGSLIGFIALLLYWRNETRR